MIFTLHALLSLVIALPAIIGWSRFRKTAPAFHPFLVLLTAGFFNELISIAVISTKRPNAFNYNVYALAESLLILWQFYQWKAFDKYIYRLLQLGLTGLWCWEHFIYSSLFQFDAWHLLSYCTVTVLLGINLVSRIVYTEPFRLYKNARYLICVGWIVFFTYSVIVEVFWLYGLGAGTEFRVYVLSILPYINLLCNLIFTLAVLCIPYSYRYIMQC